MALSPRRSSGSRSRGRSLGLRSGRSVVSISHCLPTESAFGKKSRRELSVWCTWLSSRAPFSLRRRCEAVECLFGVVSLGVEARKEVDAESQRIYELLDLVWAVLDAGRSVYSPLSGGQLLPLPPSSEAALGGIRDFCLASGRLRRGAMPKAAHDSECGGVPEHGASMCVRGPVQDTRAGVLLLSRYAKLCAEL